MLGLYDSRRIGFAALQPHFEQILVVAVASCTERDGAACAELTGVRVDENRNETVLFGQLMHVIRDAVHRFLTKMNTNVHSTT